MTGQDYSLGPRIAADDRGLLAHILGLRPHGTALEFGVGEGHTLRMIAQQMPVIGFDSFTGLPEDWRPEYPKGAFACKPPMIANSILVIGPFADTLPTSTWPEQVGLVHIDCDLYSSTRTVLTHIEPVLQPGTFVVFDEWHGYDGAELHEQRAWREYVERTDATWDVIGCGREQWAIRLA